MDEPVAEGRRATEAEHFHMLSLLAGSYMGCLLSLLPALVLAMLLGVIDLLLTIALGHSVGTELILAFFGAGILLVHHNLVRMYEGANSFGSIRNGRFIPPPRRRIRILLGNILIFTAIFQLIPRALTYFTAWMF